MNVLLSRALPKDHAFIHRTRSKDINLVCRSFIEQHSIDFELIDSKSIDLVFAYSQNGVKYFEIGLKKLGFNSIEEWAKKNPKLTFGAIGKTTESAFIERGIRSDFIGIGQPNDVVNQLEHWLSNDIEKSTKKVLFLQAKKSLQTIGNKLKNIINVSSLAVYETRLNVFEDLPQYDIILATSPSNAEGILQSNPSNLSSKWICIGPSTAKYLETKGAKEVIFPDYPKIEAMIDLVIT